MGSSAARRCRETGCERLLDAGSRRQFCPDCAKARRTAANARHAREWRARNRPAAGRPVQARGRASTTRGAYLPGPVVVEGKAAFYDLARAQSEVAAAARRLHDAGAHDEVLLSALEHAALAAARAAGVLEGLLPAADPRPGR